MVPKKLLSSHGVQCTALKYDLNILYLRREEILVS